MHRNTYKPLYFLFLHSGKSCVVVWVDVCFVAHVLGKARPLNISRKESRHLYRIQAQALYNFIWPEKWCISVRLDLYIRKGD